MEKEKERKRGRGRDGGGNGNKGESLRGNSLGRGDKRKWESRKKGGGDKKMRRKRARRQGREGGRELKNIKIGKSNRIEWWQEERNRWKSLN